MNKITLLLTLSAFAYVAESAKILGIFHAPSFSHQQLAHTLLRALAEKGHELTIVTPIPPKEPIKKAKIIKLEFDMSQFKDIRKNLYKQTSESAITKLLWLDIMGLLITELTLNHTAVQDLLKSKNHFDVVIMEQFLNDAFKGFCHYYKAPCIMVSTVGSNRWTNAQMGNPAPPSYIPDLLADVPNDMNLLERTYNSLVYLFAELFFQLYTFNKHNELMQKYIPGVPHLNELYYNTSLMLLNSHSSTHQPVPLVANMIEIGGFHVTPPKKLPDDFQKYLDESKNGVVFFSMGSQLQSAEMPEEKRDAILKCFSKLKQNVLWKWEDDTLPGQPANVKLGKWLPQQDILAHPNVKLFITHGGLLSMTEAVYSGVPLLGIPIFGDQQMNVARMEALGLGVGLPFTKLSEDTFCKMLDKALNNPLYLENAKYRSRVMHDQQVKPLDKAVYWVEYVLRHRGAPHLKTTALNLRWYQYLMLDVLAVIAVTVIVAWKIMKLLFCKLFIKRKCGKKDDNKSKKTN